MRKNSQSERDALLYITPFQFPLLAKFHWADLRCVLWLFQIDHFQTTDAVQITRSPIKLQVDVAMTVDFPIRAKQMERNQNMVMGCNECYKSYKSTLSNASHTDTRTRAHTFNRTHAHSTIHIG